MEEGIDSGDIIVQEKFQISRQDTFNSIVKKNYQIAPKAMLKALSLIESGTYQILRFFAAVTVRSVDEDEVRRCDPDLRSFLNINTPEELRRLGGPEQAGGIGHENGAFR